MRDAPFKVGDWLRFYQGGRLVIGCVEYVQQDVGYYWHAYTDIGSVRADAVRECRARPTESEATHEH